MESWDYVFGRSFDLGVVKCDPVFCSLGKKEQYSCCALVALCSLLFGRSHNTLPMLIVECSVTSQKEACVLVTVLLISVVVSAAST